MGDIVNSGGKGILQAHKIFTKYHDLVEDVMWLPYHKNLFGTVGGNGKLIISDLRQKEKDSGQSHYIGKANSLSFSLYFDFLMASALFGGSVSILDLRQLKKPI